MENIGIALAYMIFFVVCDGMTDNNSTDPYIDVLRKPSLIIENKTKQNKTKQNFPLLTNKYL